MSNLLRVTHLLHGDPLIVNERFPDDPWSTLNLDSEVRLLNRASAELGQKKCGRQIRVGNGT